MDLLAALALVMLIEGMTIAIFASSMPALLAMLEAMGEARRRRVGVALAALGAIGYLLVRS
ncbi:MAG: DUF2065 family protein [Paracoccaceae bacterium]